MSAVPFVEHVTVRSWCTAILPWLAQRRLRHHALATRCFIIFGSRFAFTVARLSGWLIGVQVERCQYRMVAMQDENGLWLWQRVTRDDLSMVQEMIMKEPEFQEHIAQLGNLEGCHRLPGFLAKAAIRVDVTGKTKTIPGLMLMIQVCKWLVIHRGPPGQPVLFGERQVWMDVVVRYAESVGVTLIPVSARVQPQEWLRERLRYRLHPDASRFLRVMRMRWQLLWLRQEEE